MYLTRRQALTGFAVSSAMLGLRSMVTGVAPSILLNPGRALAATGDQTVASAVKPQFIIYSCSGSGDPINCNVPGTYDNPEIVHAIDPSMVPTALAQGGVSRQAAQIWSTLPPAMLDNLAFFHHGTYTLIHTELGKVMRLQGAVDRNDMLPCTLARDMGKALGTVSPKAICLYSDLNGALIDEGVPLPMHPPASLKNVLGMPQDVLGSKAVMAMRDKSVDALHKWAKARAKPFQMAFLDQYMLSQSEARAVQEKLGTTLNNIKDNSVTSQLNLAVALFQLNLSPVAAVNIPFGGDNHADGQDQTQLTQSEVPGHKAGVGNLAKMHAAITAAGLTDKVSFLLTNVFGRNLSGNDAKNGRGHNAVHAVSLMYGPNIKGGVVGGVTQVAPGGDFMASPIVSSSGVASASGDVAYSDTLASMGKTFTAAVGGSTGGVSFRSGTVVRGAMRA